VIPFRRDPIGNLSVFLLSLSLLFLLLLLLLLFAMLVVFFDI
jgi:hypothetical protein